MKSPLIALFYCLSFTLGLINCGGAPQFKNVNPTEQISSSNGTITRSIGVADSSYDPNQPINCTDVDIPLNCPPEDTNNGGEEPNPTNPDTDHLPPDTSEDPDTTPDNGNLPPDVTEDQHGRCHYKDIDIAPENRCGKNGHKLLICHQPPGNPNNAHEICVGYPGGRNHLKHHSGDKLGHCR